MLDRLLREIVPQLFYDEHPERVFAIFSFSLLLVLLLDLLLPRLYKVGDGLILRLQNHISV